MSNSHGIRDSIVYDAPVAVIDFETTGLSPGFDGIVELSVVRVDPGSNPELVLDTMVNPGRAVAATFIHGITDEDVKDAPMFNDLVGDLVRALSGCTLAAYNIYFDIKFLEHELLSAGIKILPPHFCLMYMRPMLGLGKRCPLGEACKFHDVTNNAAHIASEDALASAELLRVYLSEMKSMGITTFGDLARLKKYKFVQSFENNFLTSSLVEGRPTCTNLKSRRVMTPTMEKKHITTELEVPPEESSRRGLVDYWEALKVAVADLTITDEEIEELHRRKIDLGLPDEQVRMLHARLFSGVISQFIGDKWLDDKECKILHRMYSCLSQLGWAPGELGS